MLHIANLSNYDNYLYLLSKQLYCIIYKIICQYFFCIFFTFFYTFYFFLYFMGFYLINNPKNSSGKKIHATARAILNTPHTINATNPLLLSLFFFTISPLFILQSLTKHGNFYYHVLFLLIMVYNLYLFVYHLLR